MLDFSDIRVKVKSEDKSTGVYEISPLPRGFGSTLANSLRRILLSSLPGAAVTSVKFAGVDHEYSTIDGVKEDVVEIILNLKGVKFVLTSDEPQICTIEVKGAKTVTSKDIKVGAGVQVVSPDIHIATLTTKSASLVLEMVVEKGVGYKVGSESDRAEAGRIPVDADFTPVNRVNFTVTSARKGQSTDLDGVVVEIETDGSVSPTEALLHSARILQSFAGKVMGALGVPITEVEQKAEESTVMEVETVAASGVNDEVNGWKIEDLPISKRSKSGLLAGGYMTVGDLKGASSTDLMSLPGFGTKSLNEVLDLLNQYGIELNG